MRVLLTVPDLDLATGGLAAAVQRLAAELVAHTESVTLAYSVSAGTAKLPLASGIRGVEIERGGGSLQLLRRWRARLRSLIHEQQPQVIHDHGLWRPENIAAMQLARSSGVPLLVQPCGMLQHWPMSQRRIKKQLAWRLYQKSLVASASAVIVTSEDERRETQTRLPLRQVLTCIPHGVELPVLAHDLPRRRQAVYLGRLHPKKQVDVLLRAWAALKPEGWQLLIAGSGEPEHERTLRALVAECDIAGQVRFLGQVQGEAKIALLLQSQLFLQPSLQENFGLAVAEALAHGLPVLTTREMPWAEVVALDCGWSVAADAASIETALAQALSSSPERLAAMGARASTLAARYSWAETARRTLSLYRQVLEPAP